MNWLTKPLFGRIDMLMFGIPMFTLGLLTEKLILLGYL